MYEQESSRKYVGYAYGSPRQHGGEDISAGGRGAGGNAGPPPVSGNPGCLGFLLGFFTISIFQMWEYRKTLVEADVARYRADRELESVLAQVTARLEDTTRHLQAGIAPGATLHDMDRTSAAKTLDMKESGGAKIYRPDKSFDPYDIELDGSDYGFRE